MLHCRIVAVLLRRLMNDDVGAAELGCSLLLLLTTQYSPDGLLPNEPNFLRESWQYWVIESIENWRNAMDGAGGKGGIVLGELRCRQREESCGAVPSVDRSWTHASALRIRCIDPLSLGLFWAKCLLPMRRIGWKRSGHMGVFHQLSEGTVPTERKDPTSWTYETCLLHPWYCPWCS